MRSLVLLLTSLTLLIAITLATTNSTNPTLYLSAIVNGPNITLIPECWAFTPGSAESKTYGGATYFTGLSYLELLTLPQKTTTAPFPASGEVDYTIHIQLAGVGEVVFTDNKISILFAPGTVVVVAMGSADYWKVAGRGFMAANIHFTNLAGLGDFEKVELGMCGEFVSLVADEVSKTPF